MGVKENIERAIITNDWEEIREVYKFLFKEEAPFPPEIRAPKDDGYSEEAVKEILLPFVTAFSFLQKHHSSILEDLKESFIEKKPKTKKSSDKQTEFITEIGSAEYNTDEYQQALKAHAKIIKKKRKSRKKQQYTPDMRPCPSCNTEFDYKKEYPVGEMSENPQGLCHNCNRRGRANKK